MLSAAGGGIPSDFIARYLFEDFTGSVAIDETGNYDGTVTGSTVVSGPGGSDTAADIGSTKYISLPTSLKTAMGTSSGTISMAIRPKTSSSGFRHILTTTDISLDNFMTIQIEATTLKPRVVYKPSATSAYEGDDASTLSSWNHVVFRTNGSSTTFRLNGSNSTKTITVGSDTGGWFGDIPTVDNLEIGRLVRSSIVTSSDFEVAYMTIYTRELSDSECSQLEAEY
jgi:hypothetical protein